MIHTRNIARLLYSSAINNVLCQLLQSRMLICHRLCFVKVEHFTVLKLDSLQAALR